MSVINSIENLFTQLVKDPKGLMEVMKETGDVLSGSRAANFFVDGLCDDNSDWDFYCRCCNPDNTKTECKLYKYFKNIGCNWSDVQLRYNDQVLNVYSGILFGMKIQLVVHRLESMIDGILGFHSTVPQCIIAHDSAFCAYYDLLKDKKGIQWSTRLTRSTDIEEGIPNNEGVAAKYITRGIKFIRYDEYIKGFDNDISDPRIRTSEDNSSSLLKDNSICSLSNITWLECPEGCVVLDT